MEKTKAKVLVYDLETSPLIGYTWGTWDTNVVKVIQDWQVLSVAWKWLGEKKVHVKGQDDFPAYKAGKLDDKQLVELIHGLFCEADIILAHNGDRFDQKKVQARMAIHGMEPPSPYKQLDTLKVARRSFAFTSNKLADLADYLDVARKGDSGGFETWEGCMNGDKKSWKQMKKYNKQDIPPLEEIYIKLRPWIQNHPAINILNDDRMACPKCGEGPLQLRGLTPPTKTGRRQRYVCMSCGGWSQGNQTINHMPEYVN